MVLPLQRVDGPDVIEQPDICCAECGDSLHTTEEVFLLKVVLPEMRDGHLHCHDVINATGGLAYSPHFFEFLCWETVEETLEELHEDVPPLTDDLALLSCDLCGSHVREWETMGLVQFGELHRSPRSPDGNPAFNFTNMGEDKHICIGCLTHADDELELYDGGLEGVPGITSCRDGLFERCWRKGECSCQQGVTDD